MTKKRGLTAQQRATIRQAAQALASVYEEIVADVLLPEIEDLDNKIEDELGGIDKQLSEVMRRVAALEGKKEF